VQYLSPQEDSCRTPLAERSGSKTGTKSKNKLSPHSARALSSTKSSSLSNVSKREQSASNYSLENVSTPKQKKSFFQSFRKRGRKISSIESGLGESVSKSSIDKSGKEDSETKEFVNRQTSNAQERRKAFQHAYTTPERAKHSFSRSMDIESFDYESNQDVYLANYESEMRGVDNGKNLGQNTLMSSKSYQASDPRTSDSLNPSLFVTAEQITVPNNIIHQSQNTFYPDQTSWRTVEVEQGLLNNCETRYNNQYSREDVRPSASLSMTALRPRDANQKDEPARQPVTPAFATYSGPASAEELASGKPASNRRSSSRQNSFNTEVENAFEVEIFCLNKAANISRNQTKPVDMIFFSVFFTA